jgi:TonB family protein
MRLGWIVAVAAACLAGGVLTQSALAGDVITMPDWLRKPTQAELRAQWPYEAARKGIGGKAVISCAIDIQGLLKNCAVVSETPEGMGFGKAALLLAPSFKMRPQRLNGKPVEGGPVRIPIVFEDPGGGQMMSGPPGLAIVDPIWAAAPSFDQVAAAWPKAAGDAASGGATLQCTVTKTGHLDNCATYNELPSGKGFGAAAKSLVSRFALKLDPDPARTRGALVNVTFRFFNPATPEGKARKLSQARWITTLDASKVQAIFPKLAAEAGVKAGLGVADCLIKPDGHLTDCTVSREEPADLGFGQSALLVAGIMQMNPWTDDGRPVDGARVKLPVRFGLAPEPTPAASAKP